MIKKLFLTLWYLVLFVLSLAWYIITIPYKLIHTLVMCGVTALDVIFFDFFIYIPALIPPFIFVFISAPAYAGCIDPQNFTEILPYVWLSFRKGFLLAAFTTIKGSHEVPIGVDFVVMTLILYIIVRVVRGILSVDRDSKFQRDADMRDGIAVWHPSSMIRIVRKIVSLY